MVQRITKIEQLDGLSVKDAQRMPHPADLARWSRDGLYGIDADRGVFVVVKRNSEAHEESNLLREADVRSLMWSLAFLREEAESVVDQVDADSGISP